MDHGQVVLVVCTVIGTALTLLAAAWKLVSLLAKVQELVDLLPQHRRMVHDMAALTQRLEAVERRRAGPHRDR